MRSKKPVTNAGCLNIGLWPSKILLNEPLRLIYSMKLSKGLVLHIGPTTSRCLKTVTAYLPILSWNWSFGTVVYPHCPDDLSGPAKHTGLKNGHGHSPVEIDRIYIIKDNEGRCAFPTQIGDGDTQCCSRRLVNNLIRLDKHPSVLDIRNPIVV